MIPKRKVYSLQCLAVYSLLFFLTLYAIRYTLYAVCYAQGQNAQESDQQIMDFSLASFGEKGKKAWDLSGKSADIFQDVIKLKDVIGNLYGKEEDVKLTADKGDFDKTQGKIHLEDNVIITTSTGAKLTTDSLDWDRKNQLVTTKDAVNIERGNMVTTASGAHGEPDLKKVSLQKDVTVNINPVADEKSQEPAVKKKIVITCDGPLQIDYEKNVATFNNNVKVDTQDALIDSDIMDVYFGKSTKDASGLKKADSDVGSALGGSTMGSKIDKIIARGNVKITRGENVSYSDEATYNALDKKIILSGKPKLIIYSGEDINASFGN
ncbi:MAG: LPS export ABC transporter periplasmic protein LptC [Candidatus Omnitrophica bacterium CG23_combo_of_CG06-09_8_20_14_all_40_11]|nr:MAG: LPS export ABC transporter periplasmic protein LptC [Candidatus Omnitrophica bacterium CG23_combo_of_CG06-09_8_20_14_all_40_11]